MTLPDFSDDAFAPAVTTEPWEIPELRRRSIATGERAITAPPDSKMVVAPRMPRGRDSDRDDPQS